MTMRPAPIGGPLLTKPFLFLSLLVLVTIGLLVFRMLFGLGASTNLNNGYPWGLWVVLDIHVAVAMGCGGYVLAVVLYVFNRGEFHPLVRPAVLGSAFAYTLGNLAAFIDIGRWWNFYQIGFPWNFNFNSMMFEVAWCMGLYVVVLWMKFLPAVLERFERHRYKESVNRVFFVIIAFGVVLPTMHQSSLGSIIIVAGEKISPLWQTLSAFLFLSSAIAMGFAIVIFEAALSALGFGYPIEIPLLRRLAVILRGVLVAFLVVRIGDLMIRGDSGLAFAGDLQGNIFLLETLLFIVPLVLVSLPGWRTRARTLFLAATCLVLAGATLRFNALLIGFNAPAGYQYFPSVIEMLLSLGLIAVEIIGFIYIVKCFPVIARPLPTSGDVHPVKA